MPWIVYMPVVRVIASGSRVGLRHNSHLTTPIAHACAPNTSPLSAKHVLKSTTSEAMPRKAPVKVNPKIPDDHDASALPTPSLDSTSLRMSYRIARGEQGVLTFEPYKSLLLPLWRFKSIPIAHQSSANLKRAFDHYLYAGDFVGADMARKFIQMGMTRAKRYANHKGGRKYDRSEREVAKDGGGRVELPKSQGHHGMEEKLGASEVFKGIWRECTTDLRYLELKKEFLKEQKAWDKGRRDSVKKEAELKLEQDVEIKTEVKMETDDNN